MTEYIRFWIAEALAELGFVAEEKPNGYGLCVYCKNYKGQGMYDWNKCSKCSWLGGGEDDNWEVDDE